MSESFEAYKARLLGYVGERDPLEILRGSAAALEQLLRAFRTFRESLVSAAILRKRAAPPPHATAAALG